MLMQNFGVTNKEHYGMLWHFLEWSINCWLHTRALKYNLSLLGTYFECEGVKCTQFKFTW